MIVTIDISDCAECAYQGHSGAFTPGGAISKCDHPNAPEMGKPKGVEDFNDVITPEIAKAIWGPRQLNKDWSIPSWCPLKHGGAY